MFQYRSRIVPTSLLLLFTLNSSCFGLSFLNWGDNCEIPAQGVAEVHHLSDECDAGKGLICSGQACECTYKQRYSYDPISKECRRRVGKPCQFIEAQGLEGQAALDRLPFNLKCHANAECAQFEVPLPQLPSKQKVGGKYYSVRPPPEFERVSMCVCKEPLVASSDHNTCIPAPSLNPIAEMFTAPKTRLTFRPPYYTSWKEFCTILIISGFPFICRSERFNLEYN